MFLRQSLTKFCSVACQLQCLLSACRYNVYADLQASANYLELNANGEYLDQAQAAFANLQVWFCRTARHPEG